MAASTLAFPYLALSQTAKAGTTLGKHALAAGITALVYTLLLEVVDLPERLIGLGILISPQTIPILFLAAGSGVIDFIAVVNGLERPGGVGLGNAVWLGAAYVALADLVSLGWALFLSQTHNYPIKPV